MSEELLLTAHKVAKEVNRALEAENLKTITPQQVYRYVDQKLIPVVETNEGRRIRESDAIAWISKYVAKRMIKAAELYVRGGEDPEEAEAELEALHVDEDSIFEDSLIDEDADLTV